MHKRTLKDLLYSTVGQNQILKSQP